MSFLDQLRGLRTAPQAVWLQFVGVYRPTCFDLYLFVEGGDDLSYYQPYIRQVWGGRGDLHGFNCRGKDSVVEMISRVRPTLDHKWRALFFIDKDVDDFCSCKPTPDPYLYETDYYAIENHIASPVSLSIIWTDLLGLAATDQRLTESIAQYEASYALFSDAMRQVMGWIIHLRRSGHRVVLNDVNIDKLVKLDDDCACELRAGWAEHILAASNTAGVSYDAAAAEPVVSELKPCNPKAYIRGKFDLWFFIEFVRRVVTTVTEKLPGQARPSFRVQLTSGNAIDILAPRLQMPSTLSAFFRSVLPASLSA